MTARNPLKGISRIDQPEKRTHGFFVRLARRGKIHTAFFTDVKYGGKKAALAAAQAHYQKLLAIHGPVGGPRGLKRTGAGRPQSLDLGGLKWVQADGFRCLAYLDDWQRWVNFYDGRVLTRVLKVLY
jgi:hypothetical protein